MTDPEPCPTIDVAEAERRLREDPDRPVLLDVREPGEFETVRAPGAFLVPMSTFQARMGEHAGGSTGHGRLPSRRPVGGGRRVPDPQPDGRTSSTWPAGWTRGSGPGCRSGAGPRPPARATSRARPSAAREAPG